MMNDEFHIIGTSAICLLNDEFLPYQTKVLFFYLISPHSSFIIHHSSFIIHHSSFNS